jgi:asparagine N-glycosylation enzyme membrane subunit Stt3
MVDGRISPVHTVILLTVVLVLLSGCTAKEKVIGEENIGGKYNAKIVTLEITSGNGTYEAKEIRYSIGDKQFRGDYRSEAPFIDSIAWIKNNTSENSVFLNWWDYGHMIRGATSRDVIITGPSQELAGMDEKKYEEKYGFEPDEKVKDVALALRTDDITVTDQIMDRYNARYIYTAVYDLDNIGAMLAGEPGDYYTDYYTELGQGRQAVPSMKFYNSTLARLQLFKGKGLKNYRLVYESQPVITRTMEKWYKYTYNVLFTGDLQVEDSGYIKIFEYTGQQINKQ